MNRAHDAVEAVTGHTDLLAQISIRVRFLLVLCYNGWATRVR